MKKLLFFVILCFLCTALVNAQDLLTKAKASFKPIPTNPPVLKGNPLSSEKIELGKMLYLDPRLSKSGLISCNTCHNIGLGGSDFQPTGTGHAWQHGPRNDPTTLNAVFNFAQFWDGRAKTLAEQAKGPLFNPVEMANNEQRLLDTINSIPEYVEMFKIAFPGTKNPITVDNIAKAIEAFEATLITPDSKFDKFLKGDNNALNTKEKAGLQAFMEHNCNNCHKGVNLGGEDFEKFGVVEMPPAELLNNDMGRYNVTKKEEDKYVFKTPTLRNVALTAPYFHSGKIYKLEDAVKIMAKVQLGVDLSANETENIVAFLKTLTGIQPKIEYPLLPPSTNQTPQPILVK
jgi:cytochrome c peroxidase